MSPLTERRFSSVYILCVPVCVCVCVHLCVCLIFMLVCFLPLLNVNLNVAHTACEKNMDPAQATAWQQLTKVDSYEDHRGTVCHEKPLTFLQIQLTVRCIGKRKREREKKYLAMNEMVRAPLVAISVSSLTLYLMLHLERGSPREIPIGMYGSTRFKESLPRILKNTAESRESWWL